MRAARAAPVPGVTTLDHVSAREAAKEAFAAAYLAYRAAIYAYVRRMVSNDADAEDLTVTAFEKALRAWAGRPPDEELRPWLFRIATNTCLDELRRRQRIRWQPFDLIADLFHPSQAVSDDPEKETLRKETTSLIRTALDQLAPRDRAALVLREYYGMSVEEVAKTLNLTPSTAKVVLFRARERLRAAYTNLGGEPPCDRAAAPAPNHRGISTNHVSATERGSNG